MLEVTEEQWATIQEFPSYLISDKGKVFNRELDRIVKTSRNNYGNMRISLTNYHTGQRFVRSVAKLVADVFVDRPNSRCDEIIVLDGDFTNMVASNLAWRTRGFMFRYTHQLKTDQPIQYHNLRVRNVSTGVPYSSIIEAGLEEGLLFDDIWRSTYTGDRIFPHSHVFEII